MPNIMVVAVENLPTESGCALSSPYGRSKEGDVYLLADPGAPDDDVGEPQDKEEFESRIASGDVVALAQPLPANRSKSALVMSARFHILASAVVGSVPRARFEPSGAVWVAYESERQLTQWLTSTGRALSKTALEIMAKRNDAKALLEAQGLIQQAAYALPPGSSEEEQNEVARYAVVARLTPARMEEMRSRVMSGYSAAGRGGALAKFESLASVPSSAPPPILDEETMPDFSMASQALRLRA